MAESNASRVLKLGIDEMFEDLTYNVAYNEVLTRLKANGMDDGILKDAINSGITIMFSSALMLYIQKQEQALHFITDTAYALIVAILTPFTRVTKGLFNKFKKGVKVGMLANVLGVSTEARVGYAQVVTTGSNALFTRKRSESDYFQQSNVVLGQKEHLLHVKDQQLAYAKAKVDSFNQTLLFKLLTSKFTPQDKEIIRKMTGGSADIDIDKLNEIANFMWVTDSAGNITGLSEQFMSMLNGLGYLNGKSKNVG
ncbi:hypothetical protein, partial [Campylobacter sp. RM9328]|uniref:hypothetical protein n=1 Tax=Campylobacter sp. RM9328 TaxID=1705720 RepID=UPI00147603A2